LRNARCVYVPAPDAERERTCISRQRRACSSSATPAWTLPAGTPALVEIVFDTTEDTRVVRTTVLARAEGWALAGDAQCALRARGEGARAGSRARDAGGTIRYLR